MIEVGIFDSDLLIVDRFPVAKHNDVIAFSSNHELYSDLSAKMMNVIRRFALEQFVYSINESFL
ncbi:hypothetical protein [Vibrio sp. YQ_10]|uniref:hypothetical protein n=1 Tax=Vibrio TaxID=662 RepID=UPI00370B2A7D